MVQATGGKLAVVTGGSQGIGYQLAVQFLANGYDVLIAADLEVEESAQKLRAETSGTVETFEGDLSTLEGNKALYEKIGGRPVAALAANAGIGLGHGFLDQDREGWLKVVNTNIVGTLDIVQLVGRDMRAAGQGRILITSSIASQMPGSFQAVYNASKAFLQSFTFAIRNELKDTGVSVTALLPGVTDTNFFDRAEMNDTKVGSDDKKDDPAEVAKVGFDALMAGDGDVVYGAKNKLQAFAAKFIPDDALAEKHRGMAQPGSN